MDGLARLRREAGHRRRRAARAEAEKRRQLESEGASDEAPWPVVAAQVTLALAKESREVSGIPEAVPVLGVPDTLAEMHSAIEASAAASAGDDVKLNCRVRRLLDAQSRPDSSVTPGEGGESDERISLTSDEAWQELVREFSRGAGDRDMEAIRAVLRDGVRATTLHAAAPRGAAALVTRQKRLHPRSPELGDRVHAVLELTARPELAPLLWPSMSSMLDLLKHREVACDTQRLVVTLIGAMARFDGSKAVERAAEAMWETHLLRRAPALSPPEASALAEAQAATLAHMAASEGGRRALLSVTVSVHRAAALRRAQTLRSVDSVVRRAATSLKNMVGIYDDVDEQRADDAPKGAAEGAHTSELVTEAGSRGTATPRSSLGTPCSAADSEATVSGDADVAVLPGIELLVQLLRVRFPPVRRMALRTLAMLAANNAAALVRAMSTRTESQQIVKACGCGGLAAVLLTYVRGHVRWTHDEALYTAVCLSAIARTGVDAARDDDALRATAVDEARDEGALRATAVAAAEMWGIVCQTTPGTSLQATATEVDRELRKAREREQKAAMKWGAKRRASGAPSELAQAQEAQRRKKKQEDAVFEARVARLEGRAGASNSSSLPARPVLSRSVSYSELLASSATTTAKSDPAAPTGGEETLQLARRHIAATLWYAAGCVGRDDRVGGDAPVVDAEWAVELVSGAMETDDEYVISCGMGIIAAQLGRPGVLQPLIHAGVVTDAMARLRLRGESSKRTVEVATAAFAALAATHRVAVHNALWEAGVGDFFASALAGACPNLASARSAGSASRMSRAGTPRAARPGTPHSAQDGKLDKHTATVLHVAADRILNKCPSRRRCALTALTGLVWMFGTQGARRRRGVVELIVQVLASQGGMTSVVHLASMALWSVVHNKRHSQEAGEDGAVDVVLCRLHLMGAAIVELNRLRISDPANEGFIIKEAKAKAKAEADAGAPAEGSGAESDSDAVLTDSSQIRAQRRHRKRVAATKSTMQALRDSTVEEVQHTLESLLATLWLMMGSEHNTRQFMRVNGLNTLVFLLDIARLGAERAADERPGLPPLIVFPNFMRIHHLLVGTLWSLSQSSDVRGLLLTANVADRVLRAVHDGHLNMTPQISVFSTGFAADLLRDVADSRVDQSAMNLANLALFTFERTMIKLIQSEDLTEIGCGARLIATEVTSQGHKQLLANLGAMHAICAQMVLLIGQPQEPSVPDVALADMFAQAAATDAGPLDHRTVLLRLLHAMLNLTTERTSQVDLGANRAALFEVVRLSTDGEAAERAFAARIIHNIARRPENRTPLYRAALSHKSALWRAAADDHRSAIPSSATLKLDDEQRVRERREKAGAEVTVLQRAEAGDLRAQFKMWLEDVAAATQSASSNSRDKDSQGGSEATTRQPNDRVLARALAAADEAFEEHHPAASPSVSLPSTDVSEEDDERKDPAADSSTPVFERLSHSAEKRPATLRNLLLSGKGLADELESDRKREEKRRLHRELVMKAVAAERGSQKERPTEPPEVVEAKKLVAKLRRPTRAGSVGAGRLSSRPQLTRPSTAPGHRRQPGGSGARARPASARLASRGTRATPRSHARTRSRSREAAARPPRSSNAATPPRRRLSGNSSVVSQWGFITATATGTEVEEEPPAPFSKAPQAQSLHKTLCGPLWAPVSNPQAGVIDTRAATTARETRLAELGTAPTVDESHVAASAALFAAEAEAMARGDEDTSAVERAAREVSSRSLLSKSSVKDAAALANAPSTTTSAGVQSGTDLSSSKSYGWSPEISSYLTMDQRPQHRFAACREAKTESGRQAAWRELRRAEPITVVLAPRSERHQITYFERPLWAIEEAASKADALVVEGGARDKLSWRRASALAPAIQAEPLSAKQKEALAAAEKSKQAGKRRSRVETALLRARGFASAGVRETSMRSPIVPADVDHRGRRTNPVKRKPIKVDFTPSGLAKAPKQPSVRMSRFPHVEGCRTCEDIFEHFTLPNGRVVHFYHTDHMFELVARTGIKAPPPPSQLADFFMDDLPLPPAPPTYLEDPQDAPPPFEPTAPDAPVALHHTLPVAEHTCAATLDELTGRPVRCPLMGILPDGGRLKLVAEVEARAGDGGGGGGAGVVDSFNLDDSVFAPRKKESASKDYYDSEAVLRRAFRKDWGRVASKHSIQELVRRSGGGHGELEEVRRVVESQYKLLSDAFDFYSARSTGDSCMTYHSYLEMLHDCSIIDESSREMRRQHAELIFTVVNMEEDGGSAEGTANADRALMRFELLEAVLRLGIAKYLQSGATHDVSDSVTMLCERNIQPGLGRNRELFDSNEFRRTRLYSREVHLVFKRYLPVLRALFKAYAQPKRSVKKGVRLAQSEWIRMLRAAGMYNDDFTRMESTLAFSCAKMLVPDELLQQGIWMTLSFTDFLEAVARCAEMISLPTTAELAYAGARDAFEFFEMVRLRRAALERRPSSAWDVPSSRPLAEKLTRMLELLLGRLDRTGGGKLTVDQVKSWGLVKSL